MKKYGDGKHGIFPTALGVGSLGLSTALLGMLTYYLTTQTGFSGTLVGSILLVSRLFDGVSDLLAGYIIDRCHFKLGKARPFDLATIPMWITLVLCFAVPEFSTVGKVIYIFLMYNLCQTVFYTLKSVCGTVRMKRTFVENKRATAVAVCGMASAIVATAASIVLPILIDNLENQPNGWLIIASCFAVPGILMSMSEFLFVPEMEVPEEEAATKKVSFKEYAGELLQNKYLVMIILVVMAGTLINGIIGNISTFFFKYVYGDLTAASTLGLISLVSFVFMIFLPVMTRKFGNRKVMMISFAALFIGNIAKYVNPTSLGWLALCTILVMLGTTLSSSVSSLVLIDTMTYGKLKTGKDNDGIYSAIKGFADKVANGIAPFIVGRALDLGGFDSSLEAQTAQANSMIFAIYALIPAIAGAIAFVIMYFCKMEKEIKEMEAAR